MYMYTLYLVLRQGPRSNVSHLTVKSKIGLSNTGIYQEKPTVRSKVGYQFCISKREIRSEIELPNICICQED